MTQCPDRAQLELLLDNRLADTELDELERHVESCAACQQTLEGLTHATLWAPEPRQGAVIAPNDAEPGYVVDPLGATAGATAGAHDRARRGAPTVAGYELMGELGRGGMGVVYEARHVRLNRICALKMILAGAHASPEDVARFVIEAEAIARLQHPHIVQIRHIGEAEGLPFFELEYLSGGSLDRQLDGIPWPAPKAARLAEQVALGMAEAHRLGIVHRDLKPSNVLLTAEGTPKVGDFGLAKMLDSKSALTRSESVMGSPSYMAPEQAQGHAREAAPAVDVYAVGAILYELLTGRPPFRGTTVLETLEQVKTTEPVPPSRLVPGMPRDIETIALKCLQKEPGKRYATALALAEDLRRFQEGRPILARRSTSAEWFWRWCRRNPWLAGADIAATAATMILVIGSTIAAKVYHDKSEQIAEQAQKLKRSDIDSREKLFEAQVERARAGRFSHRVGQRFDSLDALARAAKIGRGLGYPAEKLDPLRDEAIACMALPDMKPAGPSIRMPEGMIAFAHDAGMTRYALRLRDGTILVRRMGDDREIARFAAVGDRNVWVFAFSPDGKYLATNDLPSGAGVVWDVDRGALCLRDPALVGGAARFSPDSRRIALAHEDGSLLVYDMKTGQCSRRWEGPRPASDLAFRPDGGQIAVVYRESQPTCRILDADTGKQVRAISLPSAGSVAWSPDGTTLAIGGDDQRISLWNAATGNRGSVLEGSINGGLHTAFHPAGTVLASNGYEGRLRLWDPVLGRQVLSVSDHQWLPDFGRDGRIFAGPESELSPWQVDPALEYRTLAHTSSPPLNYARPSVHPNGRILAVGTDRGVLLWDLARGTELAFLPIGNAWHCMFEPSGDLLTNGSAGVLRWPAQLDAGRGELRIGPPSGLGLPGSNCAIACDRIGRIVAVADYNQACVVTGHGAISVGPLDDCRSVSVTPDGQWLATGSFQNGGVTIWSLPDGAKATKLPIDGGSGVYFSPDGRWLMTDRAPCRLWEVGTWREVRQIGGVFQAFSSDGRLGVVQDAGTVLELVETETGRTLARLESPEQHDVGWAAFSPDDSRLVVTTNEPPCVHVWDLRAIRRQLVEMGLDWDAPPISQGAPRSVPALSVSTLVEKVAKEPWDFFELARDQMLRGNLDAAISTACEAVALYPRDPLSHASLGHMLRHTGRWDDAIAAASKAVLLQPDYFWGHQTLAWAYLGRGDWDRSIAEYRATIRLRPDDPVTHHELGLAYQGKNDIAGAIREYREAILRDPESAQYRRNLAFALRIDGQWRDAVAAYREAIRLGHANDPAAHHDLAFCLHEQGIFEEAIAELKSALSLKPDFALSQNLLAWILSVCPDRRLRDAAQALEHARKAVTLAPSEANYLDTLALAEYRSRHWAESLAASEKAMKLRKAVCASDWFFVALAFWQKGEKDKARTYFDKAVAWTKEKDPKNKELFQLWAEAAELLGQPGPGQATAAPGKQPH